VVPTLFQRPETGRKFWENTDPDNIGPEKCYADEMHIYTDDCSLDLANLHQQVDHYFVIHWVNWFLATFVLRDAYIIHFWHIFDEVIELSW
jgi:phosphatidylserine synthase 2